MFAHVVLRIDLAGIDLTDYCSNIRIWLGDGGTHAAYDLGGGTFNISILSLSYGVFKVMAKNRDTALGVQDFDHKVFEHIGSTFKKEHDIDLLQDPSPVQILKELPEKPKIELKIWHEQILQHHLDLEVTQAKLELLVDSLITKTVGPCQQCK